MPPTLEPVRRPPPPPPPKQIINPLPAPSQPRHKPKITELFDDKKESDNEAIVTTLDSTKLNKPDKPLGFYTTYSINTL